MASRGYIDYLVMRSFQKNILAFITFGNSKYHLDPFCESIIEIFYICLFDIKKCVSILSQNLNFGSRKHLSVKDNAKAKIKCTARKIKSTECWNSLWIRFVQFERHIFQQLIGIPMGTNCLSNMFLHSDDTAFIQKQITFRY